jgi:mono/diheme cytochrome c family protein
MRPQFLTPLIRPLKRESSAARPVSERTTCPPKPEGRRWIGAVAVLALAAMLATPSARAQRQQPPPLSLDSVDDGDSFARYCASCHGRSGKGDGQVAAALRTKPADLTQLAKKYDGAYPRERVRAIVAGYGNPLAAHGETEMPVWGPIFHALDSSDNRVAIRIENIVDYVGQLQEPAPGSTGLGAQLFQTHCAGCHGRDARGSGIVTGELRHAPPDLTRFTARNGGVFPRERVYRIIEGRDVTAHGDRDMPIWGDAFSRSRENLNDAAIKRRMNAIVDYLEAIQERAAE